MDVRSALRVPGAAAVSVTVLHVPRRPLRACTGCETEWPCEAAKSELLISYQGMPVSLSLYLASQFVRAIEDLSRLDSGRAPDPRAFFERFFSVVPVARGAGWPSARPLWF
jgi:hypothetical protein